MYDWIPHYHAVLAMCSIIHFCVYVNEKSQSPTVSYSIYTQYLCTWQQCCSFGGETTRSAYVWLAACLFRACLASVNQISETKWNNYCSWIIHLQHSWTYICMYPCKVQNPPYCSWPNPSVLSNCPMYHHQSFLLHAPLCTCMSAAIHSLLWGVLLRQPSYLAHHSVNCTHVWNNNGCTVVTILSLSVDSHGAPKAFIVVVYCESQHTYCPCVVETEASSHTWSVTLHSS